jgi:VWFA-related protein
MRGVLALVLMVPCFAQVLPRQTVPGRGPVKPAMEDGKLEAVQVDAVALDSTGRLATGLGVKDFEVLHDGRPQAVEKVDFIETRGRRTIALIVDDLGLTPPAMRQVRWTVRKFVDEQVKAEDRISIVRTSGGAGWLQQLTADKTLLGEAADRLQFCPWSRAEADAEAREQALALSLGTVRHAIDYMREEPGRKEVVLISENLRERSTSHRGMALKIAFDELGKMADAGSVVFYAIDPHGLVAQTAPPPEGKQAPVISFSSNATRAPDFGYMILARDTGGMIVENRDTAAALQRVLGDLEGYYAITYRPDAASFGMATGERQFESLTVKPVRPDVMVRARNGVLPARAKVETEEPVLSLEDSWRSRAIGSPFASGEIHVRVTPIFESSATAGSVVDAVTYLDPRDLTLVQGLDGVRSTKLEVVLAAYGELGSIDAEGSSEVALRFPAAHFDQAREDGLFFVLRLQVHKPGPYLFTVALRDETGNRVGASSQFVEIADVAKGAFAISGLYLQGELADPAKVEVGGITKVASENAGVRIFREGSKFRFGYVLLNLMADQDGRSTVEVASDILRDGVPVYTGQVRSLSFEPSADSKRRAAVGSLTLAKEMAPGVYVLRVTVTDKDPRAKGRVARQYMDFEVRR